ncbi:MULTISPECIES: hypothetical protein [unclassified Streptomyces]|uniref:hypothetical protein n=1 Tax=unclassified Streptomyces TaxID=2593676 RepID=UPI0033AB1AA3
MADAAKKNPEIKPQDMHATGGDAGKVTTKDMHATGGQATTDDMHATSEPAN